MKKDLPLTRTHDNVLIINSYVCKLIFIFIFIISSTWYTYTINILAPHLIDTYTEFSSQGQQSYDILLHKIIYVHYSCYYTLLYYVNYVGFVFVWYSFFGGRGGRGFLSLIVFFICPLWAQYWFNKIILSYLIQCLKMVSGDLNMIYDLRLIWHSPSMTPTVAFCDKICIEICRILNFQNTFVSAYIVARQDWRYRAENLFGSQISTRLNRN